MRLLFLILSFSCALVHASTEGHASVFASSAEECASALKWRPESFTSPQALAGARDFRVVFHSISGMGWSDDGPEAGSWNEKLLENPFLVSRNPKISASVITAKNPSTFYGRVGLVLSVHPENIVLASPEDVVSPRIQSFAAEDLAQLAAFKHDRGLEILSPDELVRRTFPNHYNEVILTGQSSAGTEVRPIGVLLKCEVDEVVALSSLSSAQFKQFLQRNCEDLRYPVMDRLDRLRSMLPTFAYKLQYF